MFGIIKDETVIPKGRNCYKLNGKQGRNKYGTPWVGIDSCKYYRSFDKGKNGCTYCGKVGKILLLKEQVKICGVNVVD